MTEPVGKSFVSVEEYLKNEHDGQARHEYVDGQIYAMTGGSVYHNRIALALAAYLRSRLATRCDVFMSDMKVQTRQAFYYPDVMVVCDPLDKDSYTKTQPLLIAEIISPNSRTIDEREKRVAYLGLESLVEYLLIEQDRAEVRLLRKNMEVKWMDIQFGPDDVIHLESLHLDIAIQHLYEGAWR